VKQLFASTAPELFSFNSLLHRFKSELQVNMQIITKGFNLHKWQTKNWSFTIKTTEIRPTDAFIFYFPDKHDVWHKGNIFKAGLQDSDWTVGYNEMLPSGVSDVLCRVLGARFLDLTHSFLSCFGIKYHIRGRGRVCRTGRGWTGEFTWMNKCTLDHFQCQRASSPCTAIKTGKGNCRKLRSERTNRSPYGPRRGDV